MSTKTRKKLNLMEISGHSKKDKKRELQIETISTRLRSKRLKPYNERRDSLNKNVRQCLLQKRKRDIKENSFKTNPSKQKISKKSNNKSKLITKQKESNPNFPPGWELEVYQYKRSLKVPPNLITVKKPTNNRVSASLPNLNCNSNDLSHSTNKVETVEENLKTEKEECHDSNSSTLKKEVILNNCGEENLDKTESCTQTGTSKSIIDILHSRLKIKKNKNNSLKKIKNTKKDYCNLNTTIETESKDKSLFDLRQNILMNDVNNFETGIELKKPELISEIFGANFEDRPVSAPPKLNNSTDNSNNSSANTVFIEKQKSVINTESEEILKSNKNVYNSNIKLENVKDMLSFKFSFYEDNDINSCFENTIKYMQRKIPSRIEKRKNKRRKICSSGFDYIRKKKKNSVGNNINYLKENKNFSEMELLRTENDVSKEIQKWVLNKSVGQSVLHKAARLGHLDVIAHCLEKLGMNPNPKDNAGYTPLHEACSKGYLDIARVLLQYGANHSETAHSGIRPLHEASEGGYLEIVRLLLSYGADPLVTTYSGQTPLMLAENNEMSTFLKNHLHDIQSIDTYKHPWRFFGPWNIFDSNNSGYDVLAGANLLCDEDEVENNIFNSTKKYFSTNESKIMYQEKKIKALFRTKCNVLNNINLLDNVNLINEFIDNESETINKKHTDLIYKNKKIGNDMSSDCDEVDGFKFEESEIPLPPLYMLRGEGNEKWVLLNDLCNILKVKSRDTLLKQISSSKPLSTNRKLLKELKTTDFLQKAICLQLLCSGEKLNIRSSKVVLVKYNKNVRNILGVETSFIKH